MIGACPALAGWAPFFFKKKIFMTGRDSAAGCKSAAGSEEKDITIDNESSMRKVLSKGKIKENRITDENSIIIKVT
jgi:hypothetical protein